MTSRAPYSGWLYLLLLVPSLTELIETGALPDSPRELLTDIVVTLAIAVVLLVARRQSLRLAEESRLRLENERALAHAGRLVTVGQLAAGIAHELGSPLQVAAGRARMIATHEVEGDEVAETALIIEAQTKRMSEIIRNLLDFARRREPSRASVDLAQLSRDVVRFLQPLAKKRAVSLEVEAPQPVEATIDAGQMQQAITNLVMNAVQATPESGRVTLTVSTVERAGGRWALLRVRDTGSGMTEDVQRRLFEPFFTTKDVGEGTGLGLPVTHGLVAQNGGTIEVESAPGQGSTFSISIPTNG